jgi:hypothetical protein
MHAYLRPFRHGIVNLLLRQAVIAEARLGSSDQVMTTEKAMPPNWSALFDRNGGRKIWGLAGLAERPSFVQRRDSRMVGADHPWDELIERNDLSDEHDRKHVRAD